MRLPDLIATYWEPRDVWIGVYWTRKRADVARGETYERLDVYICLVPLLPIRLTWISGRRNRAMKDRPKTLALLLATAEVNTFQQRDRLLNQAWRDAARYYTRLLIEQEDKEGADDVRL